MRTVFRGAFVPLIGIVIVGIFSLVFVCNNYKQQRDLFIKTQLDSIGSLYESVFTGYEDTTRSIFTSLQLNQETMQLVYKGLRKPDDNATRREIHSRLLEEYNLLSKIGLRQLQFHTTTGNSYLRMNGSSKHGDPLFNIRETIRVANTQKRYVCGFEEGRVYSGFRYVYPIFDGKEHLGTVEAGISASAILVHLAKITQTPYRIYFDKHVVDNTVWKESYEDNYKTTTLSPNLVLEKKLDQNDPILTQINEELAPKIQNKLANFEPIVEDVNIGESYIVVFYPISNFAGKKVAYLVSYDKNGFLHHLYMDMIIRVVFIFIAFFILTWFTMRLSYENQKRKQAEADLRELNKDLETQVAQKVNELMIKDNALIAQSKNAIMGEMISVIAHQWKQPLNILSIIVNDIKMASQLRKIDDAYIDESVNDILQQVTHMSGTIDDFRNFFKTGRLTDQSIAMSIHDAIKLLKKQLSLAGIDVTITGDDFVIEAVSSELKQVILNILVNAKEQIETSKTENKKIEIILDKNIKSIEICDHAGGMEDSIIDNIFEPYFSTKGEKGTGVGLYMVKMILHDKLHANIKAFNRDGGAVFRIEFCEQ